MTDPIKPQKDNQESISIPPSADLSAKPASGTAALTPVEISLLTIFGLVSLCGLSGAVFTFLPSEEPSQSNLALLPLCLSFTVGSLGSLAFIWFRQRAYPASAWLASSVVLWFIGVIILGFGSFAILSPGDFSFMENLRFSLTMCFLPGGTLTLGGLGLYLYDRRRKNLTPVLTATPGQRVKVAPLDAHLSQADKLKQASDYRQHILIIIDQQSPVFADQLAPIKRELQEWEAHLQALAQRLHDFEANEIIQRDLREIPATIDKLETQLQNETNPKIQLEIEEALAPYRQHQQQLKALSNLMRRIEFDIDETLASIASIYSQLQLLSAKGIDSSRAKRLSAEIEEQADHLNDLLEAMDEVYEDSAGSA